MIHLTIHQISAHLDGELPESSTELVRRHLEACKECTVRFAALREQEAVLVRVLTDDTGEDSIARLAGTILAESEVPPIAKDVAPPAPLPKRSTPSVPPERPARPETPERAVAVAPASRGSRRAHARRNQPMVPWYAAVILAVIFGSIGYVMPRSRPIVDEGRGQVARELEAPAAGPQAPDTTPGATSHAAEPDPAEAPRAARDAAPSARPEPSLATRSKPTPSRGTIAGDPPRLPEAPPDLAHEERENVLPAPGFVRTTEIAPIQRPERRTPGPAATSPLRTTPPEAKAKPDEFASVSPLVRPLVAAAVRALQVSATDSSVATLDAAGDAWARAVPRLEGEHQKLARRYLAEARYRAWMATRDSYRAANATAALRAFVVFAPPGPDREAAKAKLAQIGG